MLISVSGKYLKRDTRAEVYVCNKPGNRHLFIVNMKVEIYRVWFNPFGAGTVFIRQILAYKDGHRTERIDMLLMIVDI